MKYDIFVFAGQSNMMGAAVLPPSHKLSVSSSFEYKYSPVMRGKANGDFVPVSYDCGEFIYRHPDKAYTGDGKSGMTDYATNTHFVCAMCNLKDRQSKEIYPFSVFSESEHIPGPSLPPYFCEQWEALGRRALIAHIAKGGVNINHYFNRSDNDMYDRLIKERYGDRFSPIVPAKDSGADAFDAKCSAFFRDAVSEYGAESIGERSLVWLQGGSNGDDLPEEYEAKLEVLRHHAKGLGFDKIFIVRVGYWFSRSASNVMLAQERFCDRHSDCFIVTRAMSFMPDTYNIDDIKGWYTEMPAEEYQDCRDSFAGYKNSHINEKGHMLTAKRAAKNIALILDGKPPMLEKDIIDYSTEE